MYGVMGKEALVVLTTLSQLIAAKLDKSISHITGWDNGWVSITVVRLYYRLLRGYWDPIPLWTR